MADKLRGKILHIIKAGCLIVLSLFSPLKASAENSASSVLCRPDLAISRRKELENNLRAITGWGDLAFDEMGALRLRNPSHSGGSETARQLLASAISGEKMMVFEDASDRADVVFCRVVEGRWTKEAEGQPPVYLILVDFADFSHVMGDRAARAAFNVGWGVLHEMEHVVHDSLDAEREGAAGECEELINRMRRECGLAERTEYFFTYLPGSNTGDFKTRFVRLAFDEQSAEKKKKRHWLIWDATLVGGLSEPTQIAARW